MYVKSLQKMTQITKIITSVFLPNDTRVMLGRWDISKTDKEIAKVIQLANEDHCGTCLDSPKESTSVPTKDV
jgi:hypothetical protein